MPVDPGTPERRYVELEGLVRVLKVRGKPARSFNVFGQFPIELIPLRVLKLGKAGDPLGK